MVLKNSNRFQDKIPASSILTILSKNYPLQQRNANDTKYDIIFHMKLITG